MYLDEKLKNEIRKQSFQKPTEEICGLILSIDKQIVLQQCENVSKFPRDHFLISNSEQEKAEKLGSIIGFYHSHINEDDFSSLDKTVAEELNLQAIVYQIPTDKFLHYLPNGYVADYLCRTFIPGIFDCAELVRHYYKKELNIHLTKVGHRFRFEPKEDADYLDMIGYYKNNPYLIDFYKSNHFIEVTDFQKHDVILIKTSKIECAVHCLIYLGNDKILHHPSERPSRIELFSDFYKKRMVAHLRHKFLV